MKLIPLIAAPNQSFYVDLGGQNCEVTIYQKSTGLFIDLNSDGTQILQTQICLDRVFLSRYSYLGFQGNLFFYDSQGLSDPIYTGLGTRYLLAYLDQSEVSANQALIDAIIAQELKALQSSTIPVVDYGFLLSDGFAISDGAYISNGYKA